MDRATFWKIVGEARSGAEDDDDFLERIDARLRKLDAKELVSFARHFHELHEQSYGWNLWGAAYVLNGGCSDDGFDYFRAWLVAQGQRVFERAIADPDSLAEIDAPEAELEDFMYVAGNVHRERTGEDVPDSVYEGVERPELGEGWDFDDAAEMKRRYPKLWAKYGGGG